MNINNLLNLIARSTIVLSVLVIGLSFSTQKSYAANVTWDGGGSDGACGGNAGDGNKWSCGANWSTNAIPASGDVAIFDGTSTKDATIDTSITITSISINAGYSGTITQGASSTITLSSNSASSAFTQAAGTFTGSSSAITLSQGGFTLSSGTFTATSGTFSIGRNFTISGGTFNHNSGNITFIYISGASVLSCNSTTLNTITFNKHAAAGGTVGSNCNITIAGTNPSSVVNLTNNGTINVTGNWTVTGGYTSNSGAVLNMTGTTLTSGGNMTFSGGTIPVGVTSLVVTDSFSNAGNILADNLDLTLTGTSFINLNCGTAVYNSITVTKSSNSTIAQTSNCSTENYTFNSGIISNPASPYNLNVAGNFVMNVSNISQPFGGANLNLIFNGSIDQYMTQTGALIRSPMTITKATGKLILLTNVVTSNSQVCTVSQGTFYLNGQNFICASTFTLNSNTTLEANGNEYFTTPTLQSNSAVIYKGNANSQTSYTTIPNLSYKDLTINATDSSDVFDSRNLLDTGLIGHWKMEAGSGSVDDSSTNNNIASLAGNAVYTATVPTLDGETNNFAMDFDGSGDYLNPGANLNLAQNTSEITVAAWIRKDTNSGLD
jgi:hypothetical protein